MESCGVVNTYLAECRDFLDSPQFSIVFRSARDGAIDWIMSSVVDKLAGSSIGGQGITFPLARCFGRLCTLSETILSTGVSSVRAEPHDEVVSPLPNEFVEAFAEHDAVVDFCQGMYEATEGMYFANST